MKKRFNLFWTGGFDSTFRLIELLHNPFAEVQPYYITCHTDIARVNMSAEMESHQKIVALIPNHKELVGTLLPVKYIDISDIPKDSTVSNDYNEQCKNPLYLDHSYQFDWMARLAKHIVPNIECGVQKDDPIIFIRNKKYSEFSCDTDDVYHMIREKSKPKVFNVWGNLAYPLYNRTVKQIYHIFLEWGMEDIMKSIHTCYFPLKEPCGVCGTCGSKITQLGLNTPAYQQNLLYPIKSVKRYLICAILVSIESFNYYGLYRNLILGRTKLEAVKEMDIYGFMKKIVYLENCDYETLYRLKEKHYINTYELEQEINKICNKEKVKNYQFQPLGNMKPTKLKTYFPKEKLQMKFQ